MEKTSFEFKDELVSQAEAARRLGIAKNTLIRIRDYFNTYYVNSRTLLFRVDELEKFASEHLIKRPILVTEINPLQQTKSFVTTKSGTPDELLSQREAAKYTGFDPDTLAKWNREGLFNTFKLNKLTLYRKSELTKIKKSAGQRNSETIKALRNQSRLKSTGKF